MEGNDMITILLYMYSCKNARKTRSAFKVPRNHRSVNPRHVLSCLTFSIIEPSIISTFACPLMRACKYKGGDTTHGRTSNTCRPRQYQGLRLVYARQTDKRITSARETFTPFSKRPRMPAFTKSESRCNQPTGFPQGKVDSRTQARRIMQPNLNLTPDFGNECLKTWNLTIFMEVAVAIRQMTAITSTNRL